MESKNINKEVYIASMNMRVNGQKYHRTQKINVTSAQATSKYRLASYD